MHSGQPNPRSGELMALQLQDGAISSMAGALPVVQQVNGQVTAAHSIPTALSSLLAADTPPFWAVQASKGLFLNLSSQDASIDAVVNLGEVMQHKLLWGMLIRSQKAAHVMDSVTEA